MNAPAVPHLRSPLPVVGMLALLEGHGGTVPIDRAGGGGACVRCGRAGWVRATWTRAGTVCSDCMPIVAHRWQPSDDAGRLGDLERRLDRHQPQLDHGAGRRLTRAEAELAYPGMLSPWYGEQCGNGASSDGASDALPATPPSENEREGAAGCGQSRAIRAGNGGR